MEHNSMFEDVESFFNRLSFAPNVKKPENKWSFFDDRDTLGDLWER